MSGRYFLVGGAGFIGSHFADRLLNDPATKRVTLYDNFSSGREWHYAHHDADPRLCVVRGDVKDTDCLTRSMAAHDTVVHLASNPDIARAAKEPDVDFREGTNLTHCVLEAMRAAGARTIVYPSGSGVYGELGETEVAENFGPLVPISTYGASKLAGEALISAYCHMFDFVGRAFRFGNVVGPRQTHGVGFDFLRQLRRDPLRLRILGDGQQSKSYIHVQDVIDAVQIAIAQSSERFAVYNVATGDYITVKEIASLAVECAGLDAHRVDFEFTGGDRGWKGDVPIMRLNTDRIRKLGWTCKMRTRDALRNSLRAMWKDMQDGRESSC
ncbi:MAG TPA: NAD-dependent epimerase/dehydratase family protein [Bryobacteraceae bacterium]|nr:NAD-dependent epimerase/dehydratase family protein [Bryobacteraceae bacterium]